MKNTANTPDVSFDTLPFLPSLLREREKETELLVEHGGHIGYYILYASFGKLKCCWGGRTATQLSCVEVPYRRIEVAQLVFRQAFKISRQSFNGVTREKSAII